MKQLVNVFFILSLCLIHTGFSQTTTREKPPLKTAGMVAYYFWEEDSAGIIKSCKITQPYLQNYCILRYPGFAGKNEPKLKHLQSMVAEFAHDDLRISKRSKFKIHQNDSVLKKQKFELQKRRFKDIESVNFVFKNGEWMSLRRHAVNYFIKHEDGRMRYFYSSDTLTLFQNTVSQVANAHYAVYLLKNNQGQTTKYEVYNYAGQDITAQFTDQNRAVAIRTLVFANGYRGPKKEKDQSDGLITQNDRYKYWYKIDNQFIDRFKPDATFYMDGSFSIKTSNHKNKAKFAWSYVRAKLAGKKTRSKRIYKALNAKNNEEGFYQRYAEGKRAGEVFLLAKCYQPNCYQVKDTVDIVCHSMGYAYSLGFIEQIKNAVIFGKIYIIAPEGGSVAASDWSMFQEVWQYGSRLGENGQDPLIRQDGIAPQTPVKDIDKVKVGGRIFIPSDWPKQNFVESHMIYSYQWIFDLIKVGEAGYVGI